MAEINSGVVASSITLSKQVRQVFLNPTLSIKTSCKDDIMVVSDPIHDELTDEKRVAQFVQNIIQKNLKNNHTNYTLVIPILSSGLYYNNDFSQEIMEDITSDSRFVVTDELSVEYVFDFTKNRFYNEYKGIVGYLITNPVSDEDLEENVSLLMLEGWCLLLKDLSSGHLSDLRDLFNSSVF